MVENTLHLSRMNKIIISVLLKNIYLYFSKIMYQIYVITKTVTVNDVKLSAYTNNITVTIYYSQNYIGKVREENLASNVTFLKQLHILQKL